MFIENLLLLSAAVLGVLAILNLLILKERAEMQHRIMLLEHIRKKAVALRGAQIDYMKVRGDASVSREEKDKLGKKVGEYSTNLENAVSDYRYSRKR